MRLSRKRCSACPSARGRASRWTADSREIDRLVKEAARTSVSIYEVFDDVLERLEPTHILTQIQCEVCAVSLRDVEQAMARG